MERAQMFISWWRVKRKHTLIQYHLTVIRHKVLMSECYKWSGRQRSHSCLSETQLRQKLSILILESERKLLLPQLQWTNRPQQIWGSWPTTQLEAAAAKDDSCGPRRAVNRKDAAGDTSQLHLTGTCLYGCPQKTGGVGGTLIRQEASENPYGECSQVQEHTDTTAESPLSRIISVWRCILFPCVCAGVTEPIGFSGVGARGTCEPSDRDAGHWTQVL